MNQPSNEGAPWTPERDEELSALAKTHTAAEIAAITGRSKRSIWSRCHVIDIDLPAYRKTVPDWSEEEIAQAQSMRAQGIALRDIAKEVGHSIGGTGYKLWSMQQKEAAKIPVSNDPFIRIKRGAA